MEIHYSYEDIEEYVAYEDPERTMLAHREQMGLPPPIPLAEPWELPPPVLFNDERSAKAVPTSPVYGIGVGYDRWEPEEDEVASFIAADWYESLEGERDEIEDGPALTTDPRRSWDEFLAPGSFADIDPALYRFETMASAGTAVEAWMTAQPLEDSDPTAALVRDRAEERLRDVAPEQMGVYDQLRSQGGQAPLEAMGAVAATLRTAGGGSGPEAAPGPSPPTPQSPAETVATGPLEAGQGTDAGPLGPWSSLTSEGGAPPGLEDAPARRAPESHLWI